MRIEPNVVLKMSEHNELLSIAGLSPGKHGISDLKKLLRYFREMEVDVRAMAAEDAKILKRYRYVSLIELIDVARSR